MIILKPAQIKKTTDEELALAIVEAMELGKGEGSIAHKARGYAIERAIEQVKRTAQKAIAMLK